MLKVRPKVVSPTQPAALSTSLKTLNMEKKQRKKTLEFRFMHKIGSEVKERERETAGTNQHSWE